MQSPDGSLSVQVLRKEDGSELPVLVHNGTPYIVAEPGACWGARASVPPPPPPRSRPPESVALHQQQPTLHPKKQGTVFTIKTTRAHRDRFSLNVQTRLDVDRRGCGYNMLLKASKSETFDGFLVNRRELGRQH